MEQYEISSKFGLFHGRSAGPNVRYMRVSVIRSPTRLLFFTSLAQCVHKLVFVGIQDQASTASSCIPLTDLRLDDADHVVSCL